MTSIRTGSRLHFGLFSARTFGGVGMMIEEPAVEVSVQLASEWRTAGRAKEIVERLLAELPDLPAMEVDVVTSPPEHAGFGSGTQLSLAVAQAVLIEAGHTPADVVELARFTGRGGRSAIGAYGFAYGGLLVDAGKTEPTLLAPMICRADVPAHWHVLLVTPTMDSTWSGQREREAFERLLKVDAMESDTVPRIVDQQLIPAIRTGDLLAFGAALEEINAYAGELFAPVQGGRYASPTVANAIDQLRAAGLTGVGQSSWGPSVFAFTDDPDKRRYIAASLNGEAAVRSTRPRNRGAEVNHHSAVAGSA